MPLSVGLIIPVFNYARFLTNALESVRAQSRKPDQVVVIDDGSTDGSAEVARKWLNETGYPLSVITQQHAGVAVARNTGLSHLTSDLVALLDADDLLFPNHLETLLRPFLDDPDTVLSFADSTVRSLADESSRDSFLGESAVWTVRWQDEGRGYLVAADPIYSSLLRGSYVPCCSSLFSRAMANRIRGWNPTYLRSGDLHFFMRISRLGKVAFSPVPVSEVVRHDSNLTHSRHKASHSEFRQKVILESLTWTDVSPLSAEEQSSALASASQLTEGILYWASVSGIKRLAKAAAVQWRRGFRSQLFNPRHWIRALLREIVN